ATRRTWVSGACAAVFWTASAAAICAGAMGMVHCSMVPTALRKTAEMRKRQGILPVSRCANSLHPQPPRLVPDTLPIRPLADSGRYGRLRCPIHERDIGDDPGATGFGDRPSVRRRVDGQARRVRGRRSRPMTAPPTYRGGLADVRPGTS